MLNEVLQVCWEFNHTDTSGFSIVMSLSQAVWGDKMLSDLFCASSSLEKKSLTQRKQYLPLFSHFSETVRKDGSYLSGCKNIIERNQLKIQERKIEKNWCFWNKRLLTTEKKRIKWYFNNHLKSWHILIYRFSLFLWLQSLKKMLHIMLSTIIFFNC